MKASKWPLSFSAQTFDAFGSRLLYHDSIVVWILWTVCHSHALHSGQGVSQKTTLLELFTRPRRIIISSYWLHKQQFISVIKSLTVIFSQSEVWQKHFYICLWRVDWWCAIFSHQNNWIHDKYCFSPSPTDEKITGLHPCYVTHWA